MGRWGGRGTFKMIPGKLPSIGSTLYPRKPAHSPTVCINAGYSRHSHICLPPSRRRSMLSLLTSDFHGGCVNHAFYFPYSDALTSEDLLAPSRVSQFPEIGNTLPVRAPCIYKPTNPVRSLPATSISGPHTPDHYSPARVIPGSGTRQLGTAPGPRATEIIQTGSS